MGNIKKWAGPLSESWCLAQRDLQTSVPSSYNSVACEVVGHEVALDASAQYIVSSCSRCCQLAELKGLPTCDLRCLCICAHSVTDLVWRTVRTS